MPFILSLLMGTALVWADPLIRSQSLIMNTSERLMILFDHDVSGKEVATRLTRISQGNQSIAKFSMSFRALAGETGWAQEPLITLFANAVKDALAAVPVMDALATLDQPTTLDSLISMANCINYRVRECEREKSERRC